MNLPQNRPFDVPVDAPILDGDGHGGRAVITAADRIELDLAAVNQLLESVDLPPIAPDADGVIALDSAGLWRYRPVGTPHPREPDTQPYERITV
ncbi:MAG TPA: hypothetical protein VFV66_17570 [Nonomuraea sp.]|nr:hypothetical protein [Nonomuraea sp.]